MEATTKILTTGQCLDAIRPALFKMMDDVQGLLEGYPMDSRTRGELGIVRFYLKRIVEDAQ